MCHKRCRSAVAVFTCGVLVVLLAAHGVQAQGSGRTSFDKRLDRLIADLESPDSGVRQRAVDDLQEVPEWRLTLPRTERMLRAATRRFPDIAFHYDGDPGMEAMPTDGAFLLVHLACKRARAEHIPIIEECYARYSDAARSEALLLLMQLQSREAAQATMRLFRSHAGNGGEVPFPTWGWTNSPECADIFFPELFHRAKSNEDEHDILNFLSALAQYPETSLEVLDRCGPEIVKSYRRHKKQLLPAQRGTSRLSFYTTTYAPHRRVACSLLDLMADCPTDEGKNELQQAVRFRDPVLKLHAALALAKLGERVSRDTLHELAADPETRSQLFRELSDRNCLRLFPPRYLSQTSLAESDLVRWLIDDSGKGRPPEKIELVKVVTIDPQTDVGLLDYYVFQFCLEKPNPGDEATWLAGVAGPYARSEQPTGAAQALPHSAFEPIDARWPEEHIGDLREILEGYRDNLFEDD